MGEKVYTGTHYTVVDEAGRITVPKQLREMMAKRNHYTWFVSPGLNGNLYLYPMDQWEALMNRNRNLCEQTNKDLHRLFSFIYGCTEETSMDRQGRMPVPAQLRELAGIDREVALVGVGDRLELWRKDARDAFRKDLMPQYGDLATALNAADGGLEKGGKGYGHSTDGSGNGHGVATSG